MNRETLQDPKGRCCRDDFLRTTFHQTLIDRYGLLSEYDDFDSESGVWTINHVSNPTERFNQTFPFLSTVIKFSSVRWNERGWPVRYQGPQDGRAEPNLLFFWNSVGAET
jgi:hypothetical protein